MDIQLVPATEDQKVVLGNLYQLHEHDFSEYTNTDLDRRGLYAVDISQY